jgi:hypothetical protein
MSVWRAFALPVTASLEGGRVAESAACPERVPNDVGRLALVRRCGSRTSSPPGGRLAVIETGSWPAPMRIADTERLSR